jgi:uncharacterized protein (TIGR02231 family)
MKNLLLTVLILSATFSFAQDKKISSDVESVKVYFNGAEIFRKAKTNLPKGNTILTIEGIAEQINSSSIQVKASPHITILSVSHHVNYNKSPEETQEIKKLKDSIQLINDLILTNRNKLSVLQAEEQILKENRKVAGSQANLNTIELQKLLDLNAFRLTEVNRKTFDINKNSLNLQNLLNDLNKKLYEANQKLPFAKGELRFLVNSTQAAMSHFEFSYLALDAGWLPMYDIYNDGADKPTRFVYKAEVAQATGELWEEVKLTLSSANPSLGIDPPVSKPVIASFSPMFTIKKPVQNQKLRFENNYSYDNDGVQDFDMPQRGEKSSRAEGAAVFADGVRTTGQKEEELRSDPLSFSLSANEVAINFEVEQAYSIPFDGKGRVVSMKSFELQVQYEYYSIPRIESEVFLTGLTTNWQQHNLLPGFANVFFRQNFTGKVHIDPKADSDTLRLSFGRDKKVLVERKLISDFSKKSFLGSTKKESFEYQIKINNTNSTSVNIRMIDHIPLSRVAEIKVDVDNIDGATYNKETGQLDWVIEVKPGEVKTIKFSYSVTSPKDKKVYFN